MITKQLVEQIEGEASLYFELKDNLVSHASIVFPHFRAMEKMLEGKNALDALVITPRVCGICGHAHLMASVRAIEDAYKNASNEVILTQKVKKIREFTLLMEMIQNHMKWMYLTIIPALAKLTQSTASQTPLKGAFGASIATKAIAIFGGQWPHSSYMLPGGITADPTNMDIFKAESYIDELISFFEKESLGTSLKSFLQMKSCKDFSLLKGDVVEIESALQKMRMHEKGKVGSKFLVLGKHSFSSVCKIKNTRVFHVDAKYVDTEDACISEEKSYAKNALYKNEFYEVGPLARTLSSKLAIVKNMHRRYKDSAYTRVMSRIFELVYLMKEAKELLQNIDISQSSFLALRDISELTASGIGVVEAPRGPLIHKIKIEKGIIQNYTIITPTQFNIGSSTKDKPTPAQTAMKGVNKEEAEFIFRTFDVCSVCTTH